MHTYYLASWTGACHAGQLLTRDLAPKAPMQMQHTHRAGSWSSSCISRQQPRLLHLARPSAGLHRSHKCTAQPVHSTANWQYANDNSRCSRGGVTCRAVGDDKVCDLYAGFIVVVRMHNHLSELLHVAIWMAPPAQQLTQLETTHAGTGACRQ